MAEFRKQTELPLFEDNDGGENFRAAQQRMSDAVRRCEGELQALGASAVEIIVSMDTFAEEHGPGVMVVEHGDGCPYRRIGLLQARVRNLERRADNGEGGGDGSALLSSLLASIVPGEAEPGP